MHCNDNPIMYVDPSGNFSITTLIILNLIAIGAITGGTVAGIYSYKSGVTGWNLVGNIINGVIIGGIVGGIVGLFAAPTIAGLLTSTGTIFGAFAFAGGSAVGSGIAISAIGKIALVGVESLVSILAGIIVMAAEWKQGSWPGDDPTVSSGDGFEWRGKPPAGGKYGVWFNSSTGDSLHPDLNHPEPIGPHWDWVNRLKNIIEGIFKKNGL